MTKKPSQFFLTALDTTLCGNEVVTGAFLCFWIGTWGITFKGCSSGDVVFKGGPCSEIWAPYRFALGPSCRLQ